MPGQYFVYIPFYDLTLLSMTREWHVRFDKALVQQYRKKHPSAENLNEVEIVLQAIHEGNARKRPIICMHDDPPSLRRLAEVGFNDTIYVVAHCHRGSSAVGDASGLRLDAHDLVERMLRDGVPNVRWIKLWGCYGGEGPDSFAERLWPYLQKFYPYAELTAYTTILTGTKRSLIGHYVLERDRSRWVGYLARASDFAVHFPAPFQAQTDQVTPLSRQVGGWATKLPSFPGVLSKLSEKVPPVLDVQVMS